MAVQTDPDLHLDLKSAETNIFYNSNRFRVIFHYFKGAERD